MLENTPSEYSTVLTYEQCVNISELKIEDLQEAMIQLYHTIYGNKENKYTDTEIGVHGKIRRGWG